MITNINKFKNMINDNANNSDDNDDNLSNIINIVNIDTLEPIDPKIYQIDKIVDILTDQEEIKKFENASNIKSTSLTYNTVDRNDILWITVLLKPRNNSTAYPLGELGVIRCKVLQTYYGLSKLKQLKSTDKIY